MLRLLYSLRFSMTLFAVIIVGFIGFAMYIHHQAIESRWHPPETGNQEFNECFEMLTKHINRNSHRMRHAKTCWEMLDMMSCSQATETASNN